MPIMSLTSGLYIFGSITVVSLISLIGIFTLSFKQNFLQKILLFLVSFAVGGLFGDAFIHLLPEAFRRLGINLTTSLLVIGGVFLFFILEKFLRWRHCHVLDSKEHSHPVVALNVVGDAAHNFTDGMIIAASYAVSVHLGIATTLAVILHEIPHEIGNFGVLVHCGFSIQKALLYNFLSALTAFLGAIVVILIGPYVQNFSIYLLPVTAGGFLYVAGSDLIPELHHDARPSQSLWQFLFIALGVSMMMLLLLLE